MKTHTTSTRTLLVGAIALSSLIGSAAMAQHPYPQPRPGGTVQIQLNENTTFCITPEGQMEPGDPFVSPPGTNFLETVDTNMFDGLGNEMLNTLPSHPDNPYNLHDGPVIVSEINPTSPTDDLREIIRRTRARAENGRMPQPSALRRAINILEGNPIPNRAYSGYPLLHYKGPEKVSVVEPIFDEEGKVIGGNVDIRQLWFDSHIESDTYLIDVSAVEEVPWTITYIIDVLNRGSDDFAPFPMYFDHPDVGLNAAGGAPPHVGLDASFFPMEDGTRSVIKIKMAAGHYYKLTYTWGWRVHPPRVQVTENAKNGVAGTSLLDWEIGVFGENPSLNDHTRLAAIKMLGNISPAKRMWHAFRKALTQAKTTEEVLEWMDEAETALFEWFDRTRLPSGVEPDPDAHLTLLYCNNTIYGEFADGRRLQRFFEWTTRPTDFKVKLLNGDHFKHGYVNVDFGGRRGWENQYHST